VRKELLNKGLPASLGDCVVNMSKACFADRAKALGRDVLLKQAMNAGISEKDFDDLVNGHFRSVVASKWPELNESANQFQKALEVGDVRELARQYGEKRAAELLKVPVDVLREARNIGSSPSSEQIERHVGAVLKTEIANRLSRNGVDVDVARRLAAGDLNGAIRSGAQQASRLFAAELIKKGLDRDLADAIAVGQVDATVTALRKLSARRIRDIAAALEWPSSLTELAVEGQWRKVASELEKRRLDLADAATRTRLSGESALFIAAEGGAVLQRQAQAIMQSRFPKLAERYVTKGNAALDDFSPTELKEALFEAGSNQSDFDQLARLAGMVDEKGKPEGELLRRVVQAPDTLEKTKSTFESIRRSLRENPQIKINELRARAERERARLTKEVDASLPR
jgi:hypothetical protein